MPATCCSTTVGYPGVAPEQLVDLRHAGKGGPAVSPVVIEPMRVFHCCGALVDSAAWISSPSSVAGFLRRRPSSVRGDAGRDQEGGCYGQRALVGRAGRGQIRSGIRRRSYRSPESFARAAASATFAERTSAELAAPEVDPLPGDDGTVPVLGPVVDPVVDAVDPVVEVADAMVGVSRASR